MMCHAMIMLFNKYNHKLDLPLRNIQPMGAA